jgi:hypothetical protein
MHSIRIARARNGIRRALLAASALAFCLPLAACGAPGASATAGVDTPAPTTSASADATIPAACSLLGTDLIEAATGVAGAKGVLDKKLSSAGTSACDWKAANSDLPSVQVLITAAADDVAPTAGPSPAPAALPDPAAPANQGPIAAQRASAEAALGVATDTVVAGGSDAFILANGSVVGMNLVKVNANKVKRSYYIQVTYTTGDTSDVSLITTALAALVATSF